MSSVAPTLAPDFDLLASPRLRELLPGLPAALDAAQVGPALEQAVVASGATLATCRPGKALYLGADGCGVRYDLELRGADGRPHQVLLLGRVLPDDRSCAAYAEAVAALGDAAGLADDLIRPWAVLSGRLVVHVFPLDPELPTLVDATDPPVVADLLAGAADGLRDARVELGHYGRRHRCVLRYATPGGAVVYGKVWNDDRGAAVAETIDRLRGGLGPAAVPRVLGYVPQLRLALLAALAGEPRLAAALRDRGAEAARLVRDAAAVSAALHASALPVAGVRSMEAELHEMRDHMALVRSLTPAVAAVLEPLLDRVVDAAVRTEVLPLVPTHGDFTPSQLLSDGAGCGLVDFDSTALGEPALDLGQYLAYLRLAAAKAACPDDVAPLGRVFLADYAAAAGLPADDLMARARVYTCISLLRTTVHAWQKLKPRRAAMVFAPLVEEVGWLSAATS